MILARLSLNKLLTKKHFPKECFLANIFISVDLISIYDIVNYRRTAPYTKTWEVKSCRKHRVGNS